jgi:hypothetical protein
LLALAGRLTFACVLLYWRYVLPTLRKHGDPGTPRFTPGGHWNQLRTYGRLCREHGYPRWRYRVLVFAQALVGALLVSFLVGSVVVALL